jgi:flagellar hook assembly protein FlgD
VNIVFDMPAVGHVKVTIYDLLGREVTTLLNQVMGPGRHRLHWDARNRAGEPIPTGTYLVRVVLDGKKAHTGKITYLK